MNNMSPVITRKIWKKIGKMILLLEPNRISTSILHHQLKTTFKNELVNLCVVSLAFFFVVLALFLM